MRKSDKLRQVSAKGMMFEGYYLSLKDLNIYSDRYGILKPLTPVKKFKEKTFCLYANGVRYYIKISEILCGICDTN